MAFTWGNIEQAFMRKEDHDAFQRDGFLRIPYLSPPQVSHLLEAYYKFHPEAEPGFYTTTFNQDSSHRQAVHETILDVVKPIIQKIFDEPKIIFDSFITKAPDEKSALLLHQDMTLVDESRFNGMNIWCPLVDLTMENSPLYVLPGSHRLIPTYRCSALPDIYETLVPEVKHYMRPLLLKAGEAVIFDQSIMHYSPENTSGKVRPVINTFVMHKDAEIIISYGDLEARPGEVELFQEEKEFVINYAQFGEDIFKRPRIGKSLGIVPYDFSYLSLEMLEARYGPLPEEMKGKNDEPIAAKVGLFTRLLKKIGLN